MEPFSASRTSVKTKSRERERPTKEQIERARAKRDQIRADLIKSKRVMLVFALLAALALVFWTVAMVTDGWYTTWGNTQNVTMINGKAFVSQSNGLWRSCRLFNGSEEASCKYHTLFPSKDELARNPDQLNQHVIDYRRTQIVFSIIAFLLMFLCLVAAFYTFKTTRYMYKRLAAALFFVTAGCCLVVMEAVVTCTTYEKANVPFHYPPGSSTEYGYSFYCGWIAFAVYLVNACVFMIYSRKRKHTHMEAAE